MVVGGQAGFKIFRKADIGLIWMWNASEHIDIIHGICFDCQVGTASF